MTMDVLAAIQERKPWLERFTRTEYADAFRAYTFRFTPVCRAALAERPPEELAAELAAALEEGRKRERFWNRSTRAFEEKQMVVAYFGPMLLDMGRGDFVEAFRAEWARRWPKDTWKAVPFDKLRRSFRRTFMGFEVPDRHDDGDDD